MTSTKAPSATLKSIYSLLDAEDYYTAQQKARTTATRLLSVRNGPQPTTYDAKAQDAAALLWEVSRRLLEKGQVGSGADLALMLIDVWKARGVECDDEQRAQILQIIALIGRTGTWRKTFTDAVFSWSSKTGSGASGDQAVHGYLGTVLYKEQNYNDASLHLLQCFTHDAARTLADVMFAWAKLDPAGEAALGRYAARGCLSYLQAFALLPARTFLSHFLSLALSASPSLLVVKFPFPTPSSPLSSTTPPPPSDEMAVTKLAAFNFLQLAVKACGAGSGETIDAVKGADGSLKVQKGDGKKVWNALLRQYEKEIGWLKLPEVKETTTYLGQLYFDIAPPRQAPNMMDMLSGMFGGGAPSGGAAPAIRGR